MLSRRSLIIVVAVGIIALAAARPFISQTRADAPIGNCYSDSQDYSSPTLCD